jgi:hypothetical protein
MSEEKEDIGERLDLQYRIALQRLNNVRGMVEMYLEEAQTTRYNRIFKYDPLEEANKYLALIPALEEEVDRLETQYDAYLNAPSPISASFYQILPDEYDQYCNDYQDLCGVCHFVVNDGTPKVNLVPCGHCFHYNCIDSWWRMKKTCPFCRTKPTSARLFTLTPPTRRYSDPLLKRSVRDSNRRSAPLYLPVPKPREEPQCRRKIGSICWPLL